MEERRVNVTKGGKQVEVALIYCAATENAFEELSGKSIFDLDMKSQRDLIYLVTASILSSYTWRGEDMPVSSETLLYEAKPNELLTLAKAVMELRASWYGIPSVISEDPKPEEGTPKN